MMRKHQKRKVKSKMKDLAQKAAENFGNGYNCAQAVSSVIWEKYGVAPEVGFRITTGLGSGLNIGDSCGAAVGGMLVLGLKIGSPEPVDKEQKEQLGKLAKEYMNRFSKLNGCSRCEDILGKTPEERKLMSEEEKQQNKSFCANLVAQTVNILIDMGV